MSHPQHWIQRFLTAALAALVAISTAQAAETVTYIHWDALGSPVAATDEDGNVVWREAYRPYGERINNEAAAGSHSRWYTGHPQDADTGLVYAGARYYDPVIGRFLAIDPVGVKEGNLHSFNRYTYANNNPYRFVDPDGRESTDVGCLGDGCFAKSLQNPDAVELVSNIVFTAVGGVGGGAIVRGGIGSLFKRNAGNVTRGKSGVNDLVKTAKGSQRSSGDIVVEGGRQRAKELFREFDAKGIGNRAKVRDKTGGGRGVAGEFKDGTPLRIRFKPDGTTRIQTGDKKFIFPE